MPESKSTAQLVWIDCEMTGLDPESDVILSLACFVTGPDLEMLDQEGITVTVHHDKSVLDGMGEWCTKTHGASGLTEACIASTVTPEEAAECLLTYIKKYVKKPGSALLAGNTVHADKAFMAKAPYKPIIEYLHHRILDVSAIKEAARRWSSQDILDQTPRKQGLHEAKADILESIEEARFYKRVFFDSKT